MRIRRAHGFTLIELMIVVAIIGVLAATALPSFRRFQLRSKAGEGRLNLVAIRSAEGSYFGEYGTYIHMLPEPTTSGPSGNPPGSNKRPWAACPLTLTMASPGNCLMGYTPEGTTYYDYAVNTNTGGNAISPGVTNVEYFADAAADIDGDLALSLFGLQVPSSPGTPPTVAVGLNGCTQVLDDGGAPGLEGQVGACGVGFGYTIY